jgi:hypothetical protein
MDRVQRFIRSCRVVAAGGCFSGELAKHAVPRWEFAKNRPTEIVAVGQYSSGLEPLGKGRP